MINFKDYLEEKRGLWDNIHDKRKRIKAGSGARMGGMKDKLTSAKTANDPDSRINKALRKWNC